MVSRSGNGKRSWALAIVVVGSLAAIIGRVAEIGWLEWAGFALTFIGAAATGYAIWYELRYRTNSDAGA